LKSAPADSEYAASRVRLSRPRFDNAGAMVNPSSTMNTALRSALVVILSVLAAVSAPADDLFCKGRVQLDRPEIVWLRRSEIRPLGDRLRIASYNIQDFSDGRNDGEARTPAQADRQARWAAANVDEMDPDIVVFEEVENARALQMLNVRMKKPYPFGAITRFAAPGGRTDRLNIAVMARVPVTGLRELDFSGLTGPGRPPRGVLGFMVPLGDDRSLLVYGVHLKSNYGEADKNRAKRRHAMAFLADDVRAVLDRAPKVQWELLVAGDTNVDPDQEQFATDPSFAPLKGWIDLWRGRPVAERITLPQRQSDDPTKLYPSSTFDRFFVSPALAESPWTVEPPQVLPRGVNTNNVLTLGGENGHVSDHYPVYLDIVRE
jgi:endonuclease/exonuclease/phosphatase family metal-dependent hydrolase